MTPKDQSEPVAVPVEKTEQFATFRQFIRPPSQDGVQDLLISIQRVLKRGRFTGMVTMHMSQGALREIVAEEKTALIPEGSQADSVLGSYFKK